MVRHCPGLKIMRAYNSMLPGGSETSAFSKISALSDSYVQKQFKLRHFEFNPNCSGKANGIGVASGIGGANGNGNRTGAISDFQAELIRSLSLSETRFVLIRKMRERNEEQISLGDVIKARLHLLIDPFGFMADLSKNPVLCIAYIAEENTKMIMNVSLNNAEMPKPVLQETE